MPPRTPNPKPPTPPKLTSLPTELRLNILKHSPDIRTQRFLARSSSLFWSVYISHLEECITAATINEMHAHGIRLEFRHKYPFYYEGEDEGEGKGKGGGMHVQGIPAKDVADITMVLAEQMRRDQPLRLSVGQCKRVVDGYRRAGEWAVCELPFGLLFSRSFYNLGC